MYHFARELLGVVVHGWIALLCYYCALFNYLRGHPYRAAAYLIACLIECYAVYLHMNTLFGKEGENGGVQR